MAVGKLHFKQGSLFNPNTRARIHISIDSLLDFHEEEIAKAIEDSEKKFISIDVKLEIDSSKPETSIDMPFRFTPRTVTDRRTILCTDPAQGEMTIFTPAELTARKQEQDRAALAAKAKAEAKENGSEGEGEKPDKKAKKSKKE